MNAVEPPVKMGQTEACHEQGEEHNVPAVRAAALTALASLDETACAALSSSQLQRLWGWLFDSAEVECNTAVRNAALKTAGTLAQLRCSLEYPGTTTCVNILLAPSCSVQFDELEYPGLTTCMSIPLAHLWSVDSQVWTRQAPLGLSNVETTGVWFFVSVR